MIKNLNIELISKIKIKHSLTKDIHIRDRIRQGGVLSVIKYSNQIIEIAQEISKENKEKFNIGNNQITDAFSGWMT